MASLPGVETNAVATSFNRRVVTLVLRAGNEITLDVVRAQLRAKHFRPLEAEICARGTIDSTDAGVRLVMSNPTRRYVLASDDLNVDLRSMHGKTAVVCGRVPPRDPSATSED